MNNNLKEKYYEIPMKSIYVVENEYGNVKIGVSQNVNKRIKILSSQGGFKVNQLFYTEPCSNAYEVEKLAHEHFNYANINGEWFNVNYSIAKESVLLIFNNVAIFKPKKERNISLDDICNAFKNKEEQSKKETFKFDLEGLNDYLEEMVKIMERQGTEPWKICEAFKMVSEQFGIQLSDDFVNVPEYEQMTLASVLKN